jgi:hypothetical protein
MAKHSKRMLLFYEWTRKKLFWNGLIGLILQQFPPIMIACGISLYGFDWNKKGAKLASSICSIILLVSNLASLPAIFIIIKKGISNNTQREIFE